MELEQSLVILCIQNLSNGHSINETEIEEEQRTDLFSVISQKHKS